jgi:hypothetical protein
VENEAESYSDGSPLSDRISPSEQKHDQDQEPSSLRRKERNPKHRRDKYRVLSPSPKGSRKDVGSELLGSGEDSSSGAGIEDKESRSPLEEPGTSAVVKSSTSSPTPKHDFGYMCARVCLSLAPVFPRNPTSGIFELLDTMTMNLTLCTGTHDVSSRRTFACLWGMFIRYVPDFRGVLLAHSNAEIHIKFWRVVHLHLSTLDSTHSYGVPQSG